MSQFINKYDKIWDILVGLYPVWIEPTSVKELTSQTLINVSEVYEAEIVKGGASNTSVLAKSSGAAVVVMINSFVNLVNTIVERLQLYLNINDKVDSQELCSKMLENARNYVLNKFFHFYYEKIASFC